jgi:5-methylthioadenosine/S-adenosylhomocysteine deaminase
VILRPYGIVVEGELQLGLEVIVEEGVVQEVRPHTGMPEDFVLSPAFVNAHSHLEYRGLQDRIPSQPFWQWINELVRLNTDTTQEETKRWTELAALENRRTGVALIAEHSNRPFAGAALSAQGIGGTIFQETITIDCWGDGADKIKEIEERAIQQRSECSLDVFVSTHAPYSVDPSSLRRVNEMSARNSIHAAESYEELAWITKGEGPISEFYTSCGFEPPRFRSTVAYLSSLGMIRPGTQLVHCCSIDDEDIEQMARGGVNVAHCPYSNVYLHCPVAPVRRMLSAGIPVGLGMDSAGSGGPIDMFLAMRSALSSSLSLGEPVSAETVWNMATTAGASSLGVSDWSVSAGSACPLIKVRVPGAYSIGEVIDVAKPEMVEFV